jgi:hypothetical protein
MFDVDILGIVDLNASRPKRHGIVQFALPECPQSGAVIYRMSVLDV